MPINQHKSISIRIDAKTGVITAIYDDALANFIVDNNSSVKRASNVEPVPGGWSADLSPVNGPTLGPFTLRADALAAEIEWLKENIINAG